MYYSVNILLHVRNVLSYNKVNMRITGGITVHIIDLSIGPASENADKSSVKSAIACYILYILGYSSLQCQSVMCIDLHIDRERKQNCLFSKFITTVLKFPLY